MIGRSTSWSLIWRSPRTLLVCAPFWFFYRFDRKKSLTDQARASVWYDLLVWLPIGVWLLTHWMNSGRLRTGSCFCGIWHLNHLCDFTSAVGGIESLIGRKTTPIVLPRPRLVGYLISYGNNTQYDWYKIRIGTKCYDFRFYAVGINALNIYCHHIIQYYDWSIQLLYVPKHFLVWEMFN